MRAMYVLVTMSATRSADVRTAIERCRVEDLTPVSLDAESIPSTAPDALRELKRELDADDLVPARVTVEARFGEDCSFATQDEADRVREYVQAASFLGASIVTVEFDSVGDESKVRPALAAVAERAHREGVTLDVAGPITLDE
jgi:endo-alpha-1,4-polygalactosaminidase (GH114 family)